jgi:hypothetical protein
MKSFLFFCCIFTASAESLQYSINWPSGLSLGEATLRAGRADKTGPWDFGFDIDASVPGFAVRDQYSAKASPELCSIDLTKAFTHGTHKSDERITFDQKDHTISRQTRIGGGGKSDVSVEDCAKDALTYIQFLRQELAHGRIPPQQQVVFGALYSVRIEYTGAQSIKLGDRRIDADRTVATIKGPSSDLTVEIFFSRDAARVPLLAKIPLSLGVFSVELQQ